MKAGSIFALASMMGTIYDYPNSNEKNPLRPQDIDVTPKKPIIQKGMKRFVINGIEIYAINHKNAIKKFEKKSKKD